MQKIESNDEGFTGIWSKGIKLECGTLFLNQKLSDDLFFNKLTHLTCISEKMLDQSMTQFKKNHSRPYVYSLNYPELDDHLKRKGFFHYDTQHVLKNETLPSKKPSLVRISSDDISLWTQVFCDSYDCQEWTESVNSILKNSMSSIEYFVDESHSSCMALYEKSSILGLYCLGTKPHMRKQGIAASMIDFALHEVHSRNLDFLILETFERDNLVNFYSKLGFEQAYQKKIYAI